jgi:hypothetical protein
METTRNKAQVSNSEFEFCQTVYRMSCFNGRVLTCNLELTEHDAPVYSLQLIHLLFIYPQQLVGDCRYASLFRNYNGGSQSCSRNTVAKIAYRNDSASPCYDLLVMEQPALI